MYYNAKIKDFPLAGVKKITVCNKAIFSETGYIHNNIDLPVESKPQSADPTSRSDSVRRAKQRVYELAMLNRFTHFITWTLDMTLIDRFSCKEVSKKLKTFLSNQKQRRNAAYIIIPEFHKNMAIHMHGLLRGNFDMINSGLYAPAGQTIYNMPQWKYGFSTAIELDENILSVASYITKYITKEIKKIFGNFYYAGGNLVREAKTELINIDYNSINEREYKPLNDLGLSFKYVDVEEYSE